MARMIEMNTEQFANILTKLSGKEEYFAAEFEQTVSNDPDKIVNYSKWIVVKHIELDQEDIYVFNMCGMIGNKYLRVYMDDGSEWNVRKILKTYMEEVGFKEDKLYWDRLGEKP